MTARATSGPEDKPKDVNVLAERRTSLADLRSHLANERTHLAYMRTSIALVGFGITLNRFGLYLAQSGKSLQGGLFGLYRTETIGILMAVFGLVMLGWSLRRYRAVHRDIVHGTFTSHFKPVIALSVGLLVFGGFATFWLMFE
jgi:putative membrane protein